VLIKNEKPFAFLNHYIAVKRLAEYFIFRNRLRLKSFKMCVRAHRRLRKFLFGVFSFKLRRRRNLFRKLNRSILFTFRLLFLRFRSNIRMVTRRESATVKLCLLMLRRIGRYECRYYFQLFLSHRLLVFRYQNGILKISFQCSANRIIYRVKNALLIRKFYFKLCRMNVYIHICGIQSYVKHAYGIFSYRRK